MERKTVLITGGSSGIGYEMAKQMDVIGYNVIICGRSMDKLKASKNACNTLEIIQCDITNAKDRETLFNEINNNHGKLDLLVNNAGRGNRYLFNIEGPAEFEDKLEDDYQINYKAPLMMTKLFMPLLEKTRGKVVNVTSGLIYTPLYIEPSYCASKAALHSMTLSLRQQLNERGVELIEIMYPQVDTPFHQGHATDNAMAPEEAARQALKGLNKNQTEIHVGMASMLKLLTRIMPNIAFKMMSGHVPSNIKDLLYGLSKGNVIE